MNKYFLKTRKVLYPVAMLVLVLSCSALAYKSENIQKNVKQVIQLFSGGELTVETYVETQENEERMEKKTEETYVLSSAEAAYVEKKENVEIAENENESCVIKGESNENSEVTEGTYAAYYTESGDGDNEQTIYKIKDGHVYFIAEGENIDITKKCSESQYYQYEKVDSDGRKHILVVGGSLEHLGWAEYIFNKDGKYINNVMSIPVDEDGKMYGTWNLQAEVDLGIMTQEEYQLELTDVR